MSPPGAAALGAAQPSGVSLTTGGIAPASLRYDRLTPGTRVAGPRCLAGDRLLSCVPARPSSVVAMVPRDVCHGPRCSLARLEPFALDYRSCHWPGGAAGSFQCVRPWGCGSLRPIPLPPLVRARVQCPGPPGTCSAMRTPFGFRARCPWPLGACSPVRALCAVWLCCWWLRRGPLPPPFFSRVCLFLFVPSSFCVCSVLFYAFSCVLIPLCWFCF